MRWGIFFLMLLGMLLLGCGAERGRGSARDGRTVDLRPAPRPGVVYEILHRETRQVDDEPPRVIETRTLAEVLEVRPDGSRAMRARIFREYRGTDQGETLRNGVFRFVLSARGEVDGDPELECGRRGQLRVGRYLRHVLGARALVARSVGEGSEWRDAYLSDAIELASPATFRVDRVSRRAVRGRIVSRISMEEGDVGSVRVTGQGRVRGRFVVSLADGFMGRTDLRSEVRGQLFEEGGRAWRGRLRTRSQILVRRSAVPETFECGVFDPRIVTRQIRAWIRAIQSCYETQLWGDPTLAGRVLVRFTIRPDGTMGDVTATENTTGSAEVALCVVRTIRRFRFRPGPEGGSVTFAYPFVFAPQR